MAVGGYCRGARSDTRGSPGMSRTTKMELLASPPQRAATRSDCHGSRENHSTIGDDWRVMSRHIAHHCQRLPRDIRGTAARLAGSDLGLARADRRFGRTHAGLIGTDAAIAGTDARLARTRARTARTRARHAATGAAVTGTRARLVRTRTRLTCDRLVELQTAHTRSTVSERDRAKPFNNRTKAERRGGAPMQSTA